MPISQQVLLGVTLFLLAFNIVIPVIGETLNIGAIDFSSTLIRCTQGFFIIVFGIFTFRQIKRKGFK
ncbi:hypothetical protein [Staphylococcus shinii]|uniref:hypothetical protein n=1 Tax=Staphylococcus shinii TaxID=2912228 RepID=UPI003F5F2F13